MEKDSVFRFGALRSTELCHIRKAILVRGKPHCFARIISFGLKILQIAYIQQDVIYHPISMNRFRILLRYNGGGGDIIYPVQQGRQWHEEVDLCI